MITGVEIDFVAADSLQALALYESIFPVERIEVTGLNKGQNEAVFSIYGTRFHVLDECPQFQLLAPQPDAPQSIWFNVVVPDIETTHNKALLAGCTEIQEIIDVQEMGASHSIFRDPFGYAWMLHQVNRDVSFEERVRLVENEK